MNSFLLFLFKSTLILSLLYGTFSLLMRKETFFRLNRMVLIMMVLSSVLIPSIQSPQLIQPFRQVQLEPVFQNNPITEEPQQPLATPGNIEFSSPVAETAATSYWTPAEIMGFIYLGGVLVSMLLLIYSILSVILLFRKARHTEQQGIRIKIVDRDVAAFSFGRTILISQHDFETNAEAILTHEISHIRMGHFYDLVLMQLARIVFWFNPLVYRMISDLKEIHEFQADDHTLTSGIDATKYQLLIIQKSVGLQRFALANSFNHCQIKNRIHMMNKQKTSKAGYWKVATFLPLLALLLMAFGKPGEEVPIKENVPLEVITPPKIALQKPNDQKGLSIEIRKDGNYIDNQLTSLEEIVKRAVSNQKNQDATLLIVDDQIPYGRVDEVRMALENAKIYHVNQVAPGSDEMIYPAGDVTESPRFTKGKWNDWMKDQLKQSLDGKTKNWKVTYSFIIDKNGKVREGHLVKGCEYPEINAAMEKMLTQIPDWTPARKGSKTVSVLYRAIYSHMAYMPPPPSPFSKFTIEMRKDGNYIDNRLFSLEEIKKKAEAYQKSNPNAVVRITSDKTVPTKERVDELMEVISAAKFLNAQVETISSSTFSKTPPPPPPPPAFNIEMRKDGNYIDNQLSSLEEIRNKVDAFHKSNVNGFVNINIDKEIPQERINELKGGILNVKVILMEKDSTGKYQSKRTTTVFSPTTFSKPLPPPPPPNKDMHIIKLYIDGSLDYNLAPMKITMNDLENMLKSELQKNSKLSYWIYLEEGKTDERVTKIKNILSANGNPSISFKSFHVETRTDNKGISRTVISTKPLEYR